MDRNRPIYVLGVTTIMSAESGLSKELCLVLPWFWQEIVELFLKNGECFEHAATFSNSFFSRNYNDSRVLMNRPLKDISVLLYFVHLHRSEAALSASHGRRRLFTGDVAKRQKDQVRSLPSKKELRIVRTERESWLRF